MRIRLLACLLALSWLTAPLAAFGDEGKEHAEKGASGPPAENPNANPQNADDATRGQDRADERRAKRKHEADEDAAKQKKAAEQGTPPPPSGAPPGKAPK